MLSRHRTQACRIRPLSGLNRDVCFAVAHTSMALRHELTRLDRRLCDRWRKSHKLFEPHATNKLDPLLYFNYLYRVSSPCSFSKHCALAASQMNDSSKYSARLTAPRHCNCRYAYRQFQVSVLNYKPLLINQSSLNTDRRKRYQQGDAYRATNCNSHSS